ncbi:hypothetical protein [Vreelandella titanicae]|uniref:hypothetical protein n=1 Tax=Vreelandella titanicae TaxID=664683 RepID=UPI0011435A08|nr:hypothetical protein [Halomonas titanicae]
MARIIRKHWFALVITITWAHAAHSQQLNDVYPSVLSGSESYELGELIYSLLPDEGYTYTPWQHMANSNIHWITSGYEVIDDKFYYRAGVVRINVMGEVASVLRQSEEELGWDIAYLSTLQPKWGAELVIIEPTGLGNDMCFGSIYSGCSFEVENSLLASPLEVEVICNDYWRGKVYKVSAEGKRVSMVILNTDGGSGGDASDLIITPEGYYDNYDRFCLPPQ